MSGLPFGDEFRRRTIRCILFVFALAAVPCFAAGGQADLTWGAPTKNVDGSPLTDLAEYRVYQRDADGAFDYSKEIAIVVPPATQHIVTGLPEGHFVWVVLAVDDSGNKSYASQEAGKVIIIPPEAPPNLTVK